MNERIQNGLYKMAQAAGIDPAALGLPPMAGAAAGAAPMDPSMMTPAGAPVDPSMMTPAAVQPAIPEAQPIVVPQEIPVPDESQAVNMALDVAKNMSEAVNNLIEINQSQGELNPSNISDDAAAAVVASGALEGLNPDDIEALVETPPVPETTAAVL